METITTVPVYVSSKSNEVKETLPIDKFTVGTQDKINSGEITRVYYTRGNRLVARDIHNRPLTDIISKEKRIRVYDEIFTPVNCRNGAPKGRDSVGTAPTDGTKIFDRAVIMVDGDYDKGGAYWGAAIHGIKPLRVKYTKDLSYIEFYRPA